MANMLSIKPKRRGVAAAIGMLTNTFRSGIFFLFFCLPENSTFCLQAHARTHKNIQQCMVDPLPAFSRGSMMVGIVLTFSLVLHSMSMEQLMILFIYGGEASANVPARPCLDALMIDYAILIALTILTSLVALLHHSDLQDRIRAAGAAGAAGAASEDAVLPGEIVLLEALTAALEAALRATGSGHLVLAGYLDADPRVRVVTTAGGADAPTPLHAFADAPPAAAGRDLRHALAEALTAAAVSAAVTPDGTVQGGISKTSPPGQPTQAGKVTVDLHDPVASQAFLLLPPSGELSRPTLAAGPHESSSRGIDRAGNATGAAAAIDLSSIHAATLFRCWRRGAWLRWAYTFFTTPLSPHFAKQVLASAFSCPKHFPCSSNRGLPVFPTSFP